MSSSFPRMSIYVCKLPSLIPLSVFVFVLLFFSAFPDPPV